MKINKARKIFNITEEDMNNLIIREEGKATEHYIDQRTTVDSNFNRVVYPLGENDFMYCYVCPNCQRIHPRAKRSRVEDDERNVINKLDYFPIPEHELPAEYILEWKTQTEVDNNMVLVNDPEGMTVYNPSVDPIAFRLHKMVFEARNKDLTGFLDSLFNNTRLDLWDEDVKKC